MSEKAAELGALGGTRTPSLLIRSPLLGFAGFLTCADFHDIASFRLSYPGFPGFLIGRSIGSSRAPAVICLSRAAGSAL